MAVRLEDRVSGRGRAQDQSRLRGRWSRRDLLEILEDRYGRRSNFVTSQLPVATWHEAIGDATLADAVLDPLVHNAYELPLKGESRRKDKAPAPPAERPS